MSQRELDEFDKMFIRRKNEWALFGKTQWGSFNSDAQSSLMYPSGSYSSIDERSTSWSVPTSMRDVDATCEVEITRLYNHKNLADAKAGLDKSGDNDG